MRLSKSTLEHAVHLGDADDDGVLLRDGAAGERGAGAARHDLDALAWQNLSTADTSSVVEGSTTASGMLAVGGERVGLEGAPLVLRDDQRLGRDERPQAGDNLVAAGEHARIGFREADRHGSSWAPL